MAVRRLVGAAAIESNLVNNAYGYQSQSGRWVDQSNRTGYGLTMSWNTLKSDPQDGAVVNLSTALLDAADETDFSAGINALWHRVELGYIYAHNKNRPVQYGRGDQRMRWRLRYPGAGAL